MIDIGAQAQANATPPDTLLWRFAGKLPRPVLTLTLATFLVTFGVFWATGALRFGDPEAAHPLARSSNIGLALLFSLLIPYFMAFSLISSRYGGRVFALFGGRMLPSADLQDFQNRYVESPSFLFRLLMIGMAISISYFQSSDLLFFGLADPAENFWALALALGNMMVWIGSFLASAWLFRSTWILSEFIRKGIAVDIRDPTPLYIFSKLGLANAALFVGVMALLPIQAIDNQQFLAAFGIPLAVTVPAVFFVWLVPVLAARSRLKRLKQDELTRVRSELCKTGDALDTESLTHVNALLAYRNHIDSAHEWPFDVSSLFRIAIYVVIPTVAWTTAIFAEVLLERMLQ